MPNGDSRTPIVGNGKVVSLHYTLTNQAGDVLDSSEGDAPLEYLHGADNIVQGLEEALTGRAEGERLEVTVPPERGYGLRDENDVQRVPRSAFPPGQIEAGMEFVTQDEEGHPIPVWVHSVDENSVTVDLNHPLAGETLHFDVQVAGIRDASAEELEHGHPHGAHGHHHDEDDE